MTPQLYIPTVSALGLLVIGHCISTLAQQPIGVEWIALAVLALFTGSLTIKIPSAGSRLSVSETFVFASVLLFGTCAGTITIALEILIAVSGIRWKKATDPQRVLFNVSSGALSIWIAGTLFYLVADIPPLSIQHAELHTLVLPLAVLSSTHFVLNSGFIAVAMSRQRRESALSIWRTNFAGLSINYYAGASLAALFVSYTRTIDLFALSIIVPLLLVSYLTFKSSLARVEDATKHVDEIKRLYLSTIETLATAIDAKDQVTHGHIRRVQQVALALARELGVRDQLQLQALEAAALLHDTGKLVVPEHILNKPGKLTRAEFEKMKQHAPVGADILSSIQFPYPVVPIVRHHHENWDGSGYPDGLRGTTIPLGARILAVVDCFDALTSDRPYRLRMSDQDALSILIQRRGVMYDPLIVDCFTANWERLISIGDSRALDPKPAPQPSVEPTPTPELLETDSRLLEPVGRVLDSALNETGARVAIMYAVDSDRDKLISLVVRGEVHGRNRTFSMPLGFGVSGWVAVNGTAVSNADPALDFPNDASFRGMVRSICVPVRLKNQIRGVLSLYSDDPRGFSDEDKAHLLKAAAQFLDEGPPSRAFTDLLHARNSSPEPVATIH